MQNTKDDRPNVPVPAPVIMAVFLLAGYLMNTAYPTSTELHWGQILAGWTYIAAATVLLLWCFGLFIRNRTTIMPRNPVNHLVIQGPYLISRNPMYLSLALFHIGIGIATGNMWNIVTFAPSMLAIRHWVITPEERYMAENFGAQYATYCSKVPRWF